MDILDYPFDSTAVFRSKRKLKKELTEKLNNPIGIRLAILGGSTSHTLAELIELFLLKYNIQCQIYESEYGKFWEDAVFGNPELDAFHPDIVYFYTTNRNISAFPGVETSRENAEIILEQQFGRFRQAWDAIERRFGCTIIQNNFELLFYRLLGNLDSYDPRGRNNFIHRLNGKFSAYALEHKNFYLCDIEYLSAAYGLERWSDLDDWYRYKCAVSVNALPELAFNFAAIVKSLYGKNKKFLAIDLDNTLWGGVIGDDGPEGIEIGQETYVGQAYSEFQSYLSEIAKTGIVLTVNSKNDLKNALMGLEHPSAVLHTKDFAIIKANWNNKDHNMLSIARELNLGIDSGVFLDDNPAERLIMKTSFPEVAAPEMDSVSQFIKTVDRNAFFEVTNLSSDDLKRGEMYKENAKRAELEKEFTDYTEYLRSLEMFAEIEEFKSIYYPRIVQLINKSNQFNLTTKRYTQPEIEAFMSDPSYLCLYGKLRDRFGDNGIVSIVIGQLEADTMNIRLWLMSCRVLKRNMEYAMMDELVSRSVKLGAARVRGYYYPTAKNAMVKDFYKTMGFSCLSDSPDGSVWELELLNYRHQNHIITIMKGSDGSDETDNG